MIRKKPVSYHSFISAKKVSWMYHQELNLMFSFSKSLWQHLFFFKAILCSKKNKEIMSLDGTESVASFWYYWEDCKMLSIDDVILEGYWELQKR